MDQGQGEFSLPLTATSHRYDGLEPGRRLV